MDYIIYEYGWNICPHCGGQLDCSLTGDSYDVAYETEHYGCICQNCGKQVSATSKRELSYIEDETGHRVGFEQDMRCPDCQNRDLTFRKPVWNEEEDCWEGACACFDCGYRGPLRYVYRYLGTQFFDRNWRPMKNKKG